MADFAVLRLEGNIVSTAAPSWSDLSGGFPKEIRWSNQNDGRNVLSANWPAMIRGAISGVDYTYAFTADAVGEGFYGNVGPCPAWARTNYKWARWYWDAVGTFASALISTAYLTTAHAAIPREPAPPAPNLLGGSADTKPGADAFSYLKESAWGQVTDGTASGGASAPAAGPGADPVVTSGAVGSISPVAGANWSAWQSMMGDLDYITSIFTPPAVTIGTWFLEFRLFQGPNMQPSLYVIVMSLRYTWT